MQIVLFVLQLIVCLFLVTILIVALGMLIVLFIPAHYLVDVHWLDEKWAKFKAHWFLHMLRAKVSYGDDLIYGEIGFLCKKITFSFDLTAEKEESSKETDGSKEDKETTEESIISKIKGMIERIKEAYPKLKKILTDEKNKEAVIHLKNEIVYLIKILLPKKSKVDAVFSTGSPDTTGQLFGVLACFPAMYQKNWSLIPDFESDEMYFKGMFWGKGRVYGYQLFGIILRIVFDKNCRRLYTIINKFMKWLKRQEKSEGNLNG